MRHDAERRSRIIGAILLAGVCSGLRAEKDPMAKRGGHPLANVRPGLADLLNQPDWGAPLPLPPAPGAGFDTPPAAPPQPEPAVPPKPAARRDQDKLLPPRREQQPVQPPPNPDVVRELREAIEKRNGIVDRCRLFDTIAGIVREEQGRDRIDVLKPLYDKLQPDIGPWLECYGRMRRTIRPDRRDPNRGELLAVLENAVQQRRDFVEGRVLAAILHVYDGNVDRATAHLEAARAALQQFSLFRAPFANDAVYAYLLLGRPEEVADFIDAIRGFQFNHAHKTGFRCWLVGLSDMLTCRDITARDHMNGALTKIDFFKNRNKAVAFEVTPLLGDAALFWLTVGAEDVRNVEQARRILDRTNPEWDVWQLSRARAALAAADERWDESLQQIDRCALACPQTLAMEVTDQRLAYAAQKLWIRPRPPAKVAAER